MKVRTILSADEGTALTRNTDYGLAEGISTDTYHAIPMEGYEAALAAQEVVERDEAGVGRAWN
ncbi:MAG: hypothetical protein E7440_03940 [Ruminococcaceae bacterium]|nr:hypothetical protein [Oscillospiraceae bacterium]